MAINKIGAVKHKRMKSADFNFVKIKTETNTFGFVKLAFTMLLLLLQVALLLIMHFFFMSLTGYYILLSVIFSFATCIYILSSNKNSYSKAVWIMFVLVCFLFGYFVYFLSDERVFFRKSKKKYTKIFEDTNKLEYPKIENVVASADTTKIVDYLNKSGNFGAYPAQNMKYYPSGTQLFDAIIDSMEKAKKFIFIEFFILADGVLMQRMMDVVQRKIKAGVEVKLIYDDMGSHTSILRKTRNRIKEIGVEIGLFNPLVSKLTVGMNYRDHRKIVVVDGKVGFTGGANLADEYINEKRMHGYWKDSGIKIEGPAVNEFTLMFLRQWNFIAKDKVEYNDYLTNLKIDEKQSSIVVPYADGLDYENSIAMGTYINLIANAKQKINIMTPYFIFDDALTNLLICKAQSGVQITIVLPGVADKKMVYRVSRSNAEKLLKYGIKLYVMNDSFVHSKVILTDAGAVVGSINFDLRSFYQQFESAVFTNDSEVMKDIKKDFSNVIKESTEITNENMNQNKLSNRILAGLLRLISPFM